MEKLSTRLQRVCERGGLRVSELADWFGRPHNTVSGWVDGHRQPATALGMMVEISRRLRLLEKLVDDPECEDFPIPHHIRANRRREYVRFVFGKHDEHTRIS